MTQASIEGPTGPLNDEDLERLECVLKQVDADFRAARGASEQQVAAMQAAVGQPVPRDVQTLYRWHDGVERLRPHDDLLSTVKALEERAQIHRELAGAPSELQLPGDLLPLLNGDDVYLLVRCGDPDASPVYRWSYWSMQPAPAYASALHMLKVIEQAYLSGAFHRDYDGWYVDEGLLRLVEDSFQPLRVARRAAEAVGKCAIGRDVRAPSRDRQSALRELAHERTAVPVMIELLGDPDPDVVRHAAFALGGMHVREALPALLDLLARDPGLAARSLARVLGPQDLVVAGQLVPLLSHGDKQVRISALEALSAIRSPDAVPPIVQVLRDPDAGLYFYAIRALARTRDRRVVEPLRELLGRCDSLGLDPVYRGGTRGSAPTPDHLRVTIETALDYILAS